MSQPFDIVGYSYKADTYCPADTLERVLRLRGATGHLLSDPNEALQAIAVGEGIDWEDERSFDSGDFPKVLFRDACEPGERCSDCGALLGPGDFFDTHFQIIHVR